MCVRGLLIKLKKINEICKWYIICTNVYSSSNLFPEHILKLNHEERMVSTVAEIIQKLLIAQKENRDVNLNKLKSQISSKYGLKSSPRLVDIISAVPNEAKKLLYPKLKAKPIRTASGVSWNSTIQSIYIYIYIFNICTQYSHYSYVFR